MNNEKISRRTFIHSTSLLAAGAITGKLSHTAIAEPSDIEMVVKNGRINQSVCKWCYKDIPLDELCAAAKKMGLKSVELLSVNKLETVKKHGLACAMVNSHPIRRGLNNKKYQKGCVAKIRSGIDAAAEYGFPNVIAFSGNREGMPDDKGIKNTVTALKDIASYAEEKKVTICIEILNSKVNHKDYMFDNMAWGVEVCKQVGSERVKILYDIYHAQIMEGDIIRTIRTYKDYIGHYHTGGNPGRNEIDETQELNYPAIMRAIIETGFTGYVGQEFIPTRDPLTSLAQAVRICDV